MRGQLMSLGKMIAVVMSAILIFSPAYARPKAWQISETNGEVSVETGGEFRIAARGQSLKAGDAVKTGVSGRAVIVRGGEYVIVSPKSRVRITKPEETGAITQIFQSVGSALFRIEKKETPHFGVKTPYLAAVVKGTTFNVTVTESGATIQVTEGRVEVSTLDGGASDMIVPGRIGRVDASDPQLLKVLGTDEKTIRSPLPAANIGSTESEVAPATGADGSTSPEVKNDVNGGDASSTATDVALTDATNYTSNSGFSGRIGSSLNSEPLSIARATGGLISGGQTIERVAIRNNTSGPAGSSSSSGPTGSPGDKGGPPDDKGGAPDDKGGPPDDKGGAPGDKGGPPDDKGGAPDDKGGAPGDKGGPPDDKGGAPGDKGGTPDDKGGAPGDKGGAPDDKGVAPGDKGGAPGGAPGDEPGGKGGGKPPRP